MSENGWRPDIPEPPARIARLPVHRGYPVPWFVEWLKDGAPAAIGEPGAEPDFRLMSEARLEEAWRFSRCWVCGQPLGALVAFTIGPMCAVNRLSAEPPSHLECSLYSVRACPLLSRPHARRREAGLPPEAKEAGGIMIRRNPGVTLVWTTRRSSARRRRVANGVLFHVGDPKSVMWFREGRLATREEVREALDSGYPELAKHAKLEGARAELELGRQFERTLELLPA